MLTIVPGFLMGLSLIVAIGAQNVLVLRQGIRRELVGLVVLVCAASDALLILAGVAGLGRLVEAAPWLVDGARWGGAAFLLVYAALAARRALDPAATGLVAEPGDGPGEREGSVLVRQRVAPVLATTLALTWLNPHVYLDTVFLLGSVASTHGEDRWWFALGAMIGSVVWFSALGFGARHLGRWLRSERAWRVLDGAIALTMVAIAVMLLRG
ncbi:LysE/ArgO family amino acid transporter [Aeromicrobium alkaliterrae]|uniref:LysE/ArgO family amino acid transporter n=1 Tax=Aeromicrobium alkaliterrae TaxID=302168 RepID=A0ABN2JMF5_9ACTN